MLLSLTISRKYRRWVKFMNSGDYHLNWAIDGDARGRVLGRLSPEFGRRRPGMAAMHPGYEPAVTSLLSPSHRGERRWPPNSTAWLPYEKMSIRPSVLFAIPLLVTACQDVGSIACDDGTIEVDGACIAASARVRLTHLDVRYDLSKPVFVNNRVPITFGVTAENLDPDAESTERHVAVAFSFVEAEPADPENPRTCGSSAIDVEVPGDGSEVIVDAFIWPTSVCAQLAGQNVEVNLQVEFDGGSEIAAELGSNVDAPSVTFSESLRDEPLNQLCRASLEGDPELGCVYAFDLQPTPSDAEGGLIDVRYGLEAASSVAIVPFQATEHIGVDGPADVDPSLVVQSRFVVNGRDPYYSAGDPALIPPELIAAVPTIEEDLRFGLDDASLAALGELPGEALVSYSLLAASDPDTQLPLSIRDPADPSERLAEIPVERVVPGTATEEVHDLFIDGATLEAVSPGGVWADESDFVVRGCFVADFDQQGNAGDTELDDCRDIEVVLVREGPPSSGASSLSFDKSFDRSLGNDRIRIDSTMSTQNRLDLSGASSRSEGEIALRGKLGKSFELTMAKAFANASVNVDPSKTGYEVGVEVFDQTVYSQSEQAATIVHTDDFSVAKSFTIGSLGFGFGPVSIGFKIGVGGAVGITTEDTLEVLSDGATCQELLQSTDIIDHCGRMSRSTSPSFGMTGKLEGGIDLKLVKAGVAADLRFITTSFPLAATLGWGLTDDARLLVRGDATWDMELQPLAGDIYIVGKIGFKKFAKTLKVNLFSFSSPTISNRLLSISMAASEELK
ncbi:hypothetical protein ACNOYE_03260 [Nannocystaceae bacterium ST9]